MWIRSQDKELLRNVNRSIEIIKYEGETYTTILGDGCHLGVYSTKEKAMEVLNDIYFIIKYADIDEVLVYEMPKDEDVEVWQKN